MVVEFGGVVIVTSGPGYNLMLFCSHISFK